MAGPSATSIQVSCRGVHASLSVDEGTGDVSYQPAKGSSTGCCGGWQNVQQQIPGRCIVGATLESPSSFRIWHCSAVKGTGAPAFKLRKTAPFKCEMGQEAGQLVESIRRGACWWGRPLPPRLQVVVNPKSGQGKSLWTFQKHVLPMLKEACAMTVAVQETAGPGHATELLRTLDLATADMVVVVGGDGTMYEALQGLLARPDWEAAAALPLAHVPCGSGNGIAHSCGLRDSTTAAYCICKGHASPMDVASVLQAPGRRMYMSLMMAYGMLANLDVTTEHLRWMGDVRFTLGGIKEIMKLRAYKLHVAWLPDTRPGAPSSLHGRAAAATQASAASKDTQQRQPSPMRQTLLTGARTTSDSIDAALGGAVSKAAGADTFSLSDYPPGPPLQHLQHFEGLPLHVPEPHALPHGWQSLEQPLLYWSVINPPFIAANYRVNPVGRLHSGHMNMSWISALEGGTGRLRALSTLLKSEDGSHLDAPFVEHDALHALVFEPLDSNTWLQLDGEVIESRPVYMEVHPGLLRVVVNPEHPHEKPCAPVGSSA